MNLTKGEESKVYRIVPSGECPYDFQDFEMFKPECAFHSHLKLVEDKST